MTRRVAAAPAQAALRSGNVAAAAAAIGSGWKQAGPVQVLPGDLADAYADPASFGFSRLALLEAAMTQDKAVARVVREGKQSALGLAIPAQGKVVFDGTPDQLTTDVARTIYGADGLKEAFSEAMTSTSIAPITLRTSSAQPAP